MAYKPRTIKGAFMPSIKQLKAFNFQGWIDAEQREIQAAGRQRAGVGRRRNHGDRRRRPKPAPRLSRRSDGRIFLSAERRHFSAPDGSSGQAAAGDADQRRRDFSPAEAHAPFAATPRPAAIGMVVEMPRPEGAMDALRMVLPELPSTRASRGSETEKHRERSAAALRTVLRRRRVCASANIAERFILANRRYARH